MNSDGWEIDGPWPGQLWILPRPRGGDWLVDDLSKWRARGFDLIVSMLDDREINDLNLQQEAVTAGRIGIEFQSFAIADRDVPIDGSAFDTLGHCVLDVLMAGRTVGIHCRQGIGRSGMLAVAVLVLSGARIDAAIDRVTATRGTLVPETAEQRLWLINWSEQLQMIS